MKKAMFKTLCILTLALFVLSMSGTAMSEAAASKVKGSTVVEVTQLGQINKALKQGPVFLKLGADWCSHCKAFGPTHKELAKEYSGKATFMSVDIDRSPKLADYFGAREIPDCYVIVGIKNGKYVYMRQNGITTTDRSKAIITRDNNKNVYEKVLNFATKK